MPMRTVMLLPLVLLVAACVQPASPPPAPPPPTQQPPPAAAPAPIAGAGPIWDVTRVTCGQLLGADDDDRAAAIMFYYGYLAASSHIRLIDVSKIDQNVHRVMDRCMQEPELTIPQAYRLTFGRARRG